MCTNINSGEQQFSNRTPRDISSGVNGVHNMVTSTYPVQINCPLEVSSDDSPGFIATSLQDQVTELNQLVQAHEALVDKIVNHYEGRGVNRANLIEAGRLGLLLAAPHFEPEQGVKFSTYASWWIKDSIKNALRTAAQPTVPELWC